MKATIILALVGLLGISANGATLNSAQSLNPYDYLNFGDIAKKYVTAFQRIMPCGYAAWDLPALAPYTMDHYAYNLTGDDYSLVGSFDNLYVDGLNKWTILDFGYNATTQVFNFDVVHNYIQLLSEYSINATAYIAGFPLTYAGEGVLNWKYTDLRTIGSYTFQNNNNNNQNGLEIVDFDMQVLLGDVQTSNWNNFWDNQINNFVNKFQREYVLLYVQQSQSYFVDLYKNYVLTALNRQIADLSMTELLEAMVGLTMELDEVQCPQN
ncbi:uncharacterized protein LOC119682896 [Teleopsis dalmanni]|uniref:uncharacterized protein LOC119682896 n=1 Tax=Teleopsis dalmanni TaxID=139649 RepID=UPI0018CC7C1F|nr:uncharacterized protein LOC119682896 [Teleopsis dalmanni]